MNKKRIPPIIVSILMIFAGYRMYSTGTDGRYNLPVSPGFAILIILIFSAFLVYSIVAKKKEFKKRIRRLSDSETMVCKKCNSKYKTEYVEIPMCPKCEGKLIGDREPK